MSLGDSYTIGTSVADHERWPNQLVAALGEPAPLELVANLGVNGESSGELIRGQMPRLVALAPGFVTLLIGVNDVVRGVGPERYRVNFEQILDGLLALLPPERILAVSTPDYTLTPMGAAFGDPSQQRAAIAEVNAILGREAAARGISFVDIGSVADRVAADRALVAVDGLHPSGAQYAAWVELIAPVARRLLGRGPSAP